MARSSYFLLRGVSSACYVSSPPRIVPERHTHIYSHVHKITYLRLTIAPRRGDASPVSSPVQSSPVQSSLVQSGLGSTGLNSHHLPIETAPERILRNASNISNIREMISQAFGIALRFIKCLFPYHFSRVSMLHSLSMLRSYRSNIEHTLKFACIHRTQNIYTYIDTYKYTHRRACTQRVITRQGPAWREKKWSACTYDIHIWCSKLPFVDIYIKRSLKYRGFHRVDYYGRFFHVSQ